MKKITLLFAIITMTCGISFAQDINFDPDSMEGIGPGWLGFMNVSNLPAPDGDGAYQFGSGWGVPDLVAINNMDGTATLRPNRINDIADYWQGGPPPGMLRGNKIMDASYFIEDTDLRGQMFTFNFSIPANSLNNTGLGTYDFAVTAFIKVFDAGFTTVLDSDIVDIRSATGDFTLTMDATTYNTDENIQYGFQFIGPNIGIDAMWDADYAALGGIDIDQNAALSISDQEVSQFKAFPNPTQNSWTIKTTQIVDEIQIFDVLGKKVIGLIPDAREFDIDASQLPNGIYFARLTSPSGINSIKLVKE